MNTRAQDSIVIPDRLIALIENLYSESQDYLDNHQDAQLWYNRGYANGMIDTLCELGYRDAVTARIVRDPPEAISGHEVMAWGKAWRHGHDNGSSDTRDVLPPAASAE
jgi:hypothetical protein